MSDSLIESRENHGRVRAILVEATCRSGEIVDQPDFLIVFRDGT